MIILKNNYYLSLIVAFSIVVQCLSFSALAQRKTGRSKNVDVYMGAAIKKPVERKQTQFISAKGKEYVTHTYYLGEDIYTVYDTTLQPVSKVKYDRLHSDKTFTHKGFIGLKDKEVLLTAKTLQYDKANAVYLSLLDQESLALKDALEITRVDRNGYYEAFGAAHLNYSVSEDGSKFLVYFKMKAESKSEIGTQRFRFVAFNSELKKLWTEDVEFKAEIGGYLLGGTDWETEVGSTSICIANNGSAYCWGRTDKGDAFEHEYRYNVKLSKISEEGHEEVKLAGDQSKRIRDWTIQGTDEGMIMAANYMDWENTSKSFLEKSDGFAFVSWSGAVKQRPTLKFLEFDYDYMTLNQSSSITKRVKRDSKGPAGAFEDNFNINGFERIDQDNYLVLGESRHDSTKYNAHLAIDITTYARGDIHLFSVNPNNGKLNWSTRIPRRQGNKTGEGLGYACKVVDNKVYVLFNDHFDNIEKDWDLLKGVSKFGKMDNPITMMAISMEEPRAKVKREKLWTSAKTEGYFETRNFHSNSDSNEALLYINSKVGKERFVRMIFK